MGSLTVLLTCVLRHMNPPCKEYLVRVSANLDMGNGKYKSMYSVSGRNISLFIHNHSVQISQEQFITLFTILEKRTHHAILLCHLGAVRFHSVCCSS